MDESRFDINWVGYLETGDKVWGWFYDSQQAVEPMHRRNIYCFWAVRGKTISINKHTHMSSNAINKNLSDAKVKNGYVSKSTSELIEMWPSFMTDLEHRFIWLKLSEKI